MQIAVDSDLTFLLAYTHDEKKIINQGDYMSASYDKNESISVDGKMFHYTPDRKEFLEGLIGKYPNQTSFTKEEIEVLGHVLLVEQYQKVSVQTKYRFRYDFQS